MAEEFNSTSVVESADTGPFFHNHTVKTLEESIAFYGTAAFQSTPLSIGNGPVKVAISSHPNDPEVQAISAFLRVLNALENIRSSISVVQRARQMSSVEHLREAAGLALAEIDDALQVLSTGALESTADPQVLASKAQLVSARSLLLAVAAQASATGAGKVLDESTRRLRAARIALVDDSSLPATFRN